ncbi:hypothetical protein RIR_jg16084.t1 [Rhizophagus irregularis DAOM 181602=DAOM 197198]|nr:hypothetical protein RIR_jg16084.t1 [Rhizophagus irregularis DAOM 181602=DAOM 197198]
MQYSFFLSLFFFIFLSIFFFYSFIYQVEKLIIFNHQLKCTVLYVKLRIFFIKFFNRRVFLYGNYLFYQK